MNKKLAIVPLVLSGVAILSACSAARFGLSPQGNAVTNGKTGAPAVAAQAGAPGVMRSSDSSTTSSVGANQQVQAGSVLPPLPPVNRMIIKNGSLSIMVDDTEAALSQVATLVHSEQGVINNQAVRTENGKVFATLTIEVPADNFEDTLARLREMRARGSQVLMDSVSGQDVTEQYVDLDAQYRNLQSTRDAYQTLLGKATSVSDIITLTREVANIQTQMDQIKGRQNILSHRSAVSTIALNLAPVGAGFRPQTLPRPIEAAAQAWQALLIGLQGLAVALIWMAILVPIPAMVLLAAWIIYRRLTVPTANS